ncbi:MAG: LPS export ABC transporter periplasmic protein LptC [Deltaproteobacteria bacterium]|nr:LPS export ABC transporter periplasmic protein LptC [Deltaproteobacteria bacterium]
MFKPGNKIGDDFETGQMDSEDGLKLENIHYIQDDPDEGVKWILDAGEVRFSEDKQSISFDNFELNLSPDSERTIKLSGDSGNYNRSLKELELKGKLRACTKDGYSIITEHLFFRQDEGILSSEESVDLSGPFMTVKGMGFRLDIEDMNLKILKDVTTLIDRALLIP